MSAIHLQSRRAEVEPPSSNASPVLSAAHARLIVEGMGFTHRGGTASAACREVWPSAAQCRDIGWLASKTGTPAFVHETYTAAERAAHCDAVMKWNPTNSSQGRRKSTEISRCVMQPYKWFVALVKDGDTLDGPYTRAIAVLADRNYLLDGRVDSRGDSGANVAAELAMLYIRATRPARESAGQARRGD